MKASLYLLTGLLIISSLASVIPSSGSSLNIVPNSCQVSKTSTNDNFNCQCTGGSGNYEWRYYELPEGWKSKNNQISAPKDEIKDDHVYGCKVKVTDKNTRKSVSKSLFFKCKNGKINSITDYYFDFNVNHIFPGSNDFGGSSSGSSSSSSGNSNSNSVTNTDITIVKNIFNGIRGIGGGCGLSKLRPYVLANGSFYTDSSNPYLNQLPTADQVNIILTNGNSGECKNLIIFVVRSKITCQNKITFLQTLLQQIQQKIITVNTNISETTQLIVTIKAQIAALQVQLTTLQSSSSSTVNITALTAQVTTFQNTIKQAQYNQTTLQTSLSQLNININGYQQEISTLVITQKQYQSDVDSKSTQIDSINVQISDLQKQIQALTAQVTTLTTQRQEIQVKITQIKTKIESINVQITSANERIRQININIQSIQNTITSAQAQIEQLQILIKTSTNTQQTIKNIQLQLSQLQIKLTTTTNLLSNYQAVYYEFSSNINIFIQLIQYNSYACYRTVYNDNKYYFRQDNEGRIQFDNKNNLISYLGRVFGKVSTSSNIGLTSIFNIFKETSEFFTGDLFDGFGGIRGSSEGKSYSNSAITLNHCNIFSNQWTKVYGNVLQNPKSDDNDKKFKENDFVCPAPGVTQGQNSYKGTIKSVKGYNAHVVDDKGKSCTLYFGSGTLIQSANKFVPQAGDNIYWIGANKPGGKSNQYNVYQCTTF